MPMTPERWAFLNEYANNVFGSQDEHLAHLMEEAVDAGLPDIAVTAVAGRTLMLLTSMTRGLLAIEVGTLAGYSGIWLARGLKPEGRLITVEYEESHADFARDQFERAGIGDRVEIRLGSALEVLGKLSKELNPGSVDVLFIDAAKSEYVDYFKTMRSLVAVGGLVLADNVYGTGLGWIDEGHGTDDFNRLLASDPEFEAVAVPLGGGLLIARRVPQP